MRVMAIDYGDARTGIAVSDLTRTITGEAFTFHEHKEDKVLEEIRRLVAEKSVDTLVLGNPINMDGSMGERAVKNAAFAERIKEKTGITPVLWDERRTTVDAYRILNENNSRGAKRKASIDAVAASLILEAYLNSAGR